MAVSFGSTPFSVLTDDGWLPLPVRDTNGVRTWTAALLVAGSANLSNLLGAISVVTVRPAIGTVDGGSLIVEAGVGVRTLTIPVRDGTEQQWRAVLVEAQPEGVLSPSHVYRVTATFVLGNRVT